MNKLQKLKQKEEEFEIELDNHKKGTKPYDMICDELDNIRCDILELS